MAGIRYPYHVKHAGREYAPGEVIQVNDPAPYIERGAKIATEQIAAVKPTRKKAVKPKEEE